MVRSISDSAGSTLRTSARPLSTTAPGARSGPGPAESNRTRLVSGKPAGQVTEQLMDAAAVQTMDDPVAPGIIGRKREHDASSLADRFFDDQRLACRRGGQHSLAGASGWYGGSRARRRGLHPLAGAFGLVWRASPAGAVAGTRACGSGTSRVILRNRRVRRSPYCGSANGLKMGWSLIQSANR